MNLIKKNEFLRNQFSSQDEKMKSLEQKLVEAEAKLENWSNTKLPVDNKFVCVTIPVKLKYKIYIPPFKGNHKENAYFARLDNDNSFDVDAEVTKPVFKPTIRVQKKSIFEPTCHLCGIVGHIRPHCSLLRQIPKFEIRSAIRNIDVPKFVHICHFCGLIGHIRPNCHKLKFNHSLFLSRICDDISSATSLDKLFHLLLKNLNLLAYERKLQDFSLSQKNCVIPQIHSASHGFSPSKPKTCAVCVRKDLLR